MDISNLVNHSEPTDCRWTMLVWGLYDRDVGNWSSKRRLWASFSQQRDYHVKPTTKVTFKPMKLDELKQYSVI